MAKITYVHTDGRPQTIEVKNGLSVMQGAVTNGIDGIVAECGGNCMCATCHVYVEADQLARLKPMSDEEDAMLDEAKAERRPNSRLSCQLKVAPALDGLVVQLPDRQV
jgi:2Fe-2S ferredoxin